MISPNSKYLLTSVGVHAAAVGLLLFAPVLSSRTVQDTPSPILEIIPDNLRLTDGNTIGGGNPNAQPPKGGPQQSAPPPPPFQEPPPPTPPPKAPPLKTPPPEPTKVEEAPPEPTKTEEVPPKKNLATEIQRSTPNAPKAQDVDPTLSTKKQKASKSDFQLAEAPKKRSKKDIEAERKASEAAADAQEAREAREHQARVAAARDAWNRAQQARADAVRGVASNLGKNLSGSTSFEMPGPGGAAYAPYGSYLMAFYKLRWKKPTTLNVDHGEVEAEITVQRNGRVSAFKLVNPSGIRALDDSVREVLERNRDLRPLPDGTTDTERRITIRFDLSAASPT
jgi:TonB family protein